MSRKSPKDYKKKWFDHYKKIADAKGVKFTERQFKRIEYGKCFEEACKDTGKSGFNALFWWTYSDPLEKLMAQPNSLINLINRVENDIWYGGFISIPVNYSEDK